MEEIDQREELRKLTDIAKEKAQKYFWITAFCIGGGFIVFSIICRFFGWPLVSLWENIGAAILIPGLLVWFQKIVSLAVRSGRPPISEYLGMMKSDLRMMGVSLRDVYNKPEEFDENTRKIYEQTRNRPLNFKFLLLDPESEYLRLRAREEGKDIVDFWKEIRDTIKELKTFKFHDTRSHPNVNVKVYTYDTPATHSLIWVDKMMYVGPYLRKRPGYETLWVKTISKEKIYDQLEIDFNDVLADKEKTIELEAEEHFEKILERIEKLKREAEKKEKS